MTAVLEAVLLGCSVLSIGGLILLILLFSFVWVFFMGAGAVAGIACGGALAGLTNLLSPTISAEDSWNILRYSADMGYLAGGLIGFTQALLICARKQNRVASELKRRCILVLAYSVMASALTTGAAFPEAIISLASVLVIVMLVAGLANAFGRGKAKKGNPAYEDGFQTKAVARLTESLRGALGLMRRSDWVGIGFATFSFLIMFGSPERPTVFEWETLVSYPDNGRTERPSNSGLRANGVPTTHSSLESASRVATNTTNAEVYVVTTRNGDMANVRACASTACNIIDTAIHGERIVATWTELGESVNGNRKWVAFERDDTIIYIHSSLLKLSG